MKKSKRLLPVLQLKERDEKAAAKRLGEVQQELNASIKQLEELQAYRQDYYTKLSNDPKNGLPSVPATILEKYQLFLAKLNAVVERQQEAIELNRQHVEAQRKNWVVANSRLKSMHDLIVRAKEEETMLLDKQEQSQIDERSQYRKREW